MPSASMHGMTQAALERRIESVLETVQKPSRYIGGEANQVQKPQATTVVALCYPDAYEVGISNQALQILYQQVNGRTGMAAERVYCPWPDMADAMRREGLPLFTLETWRPVREVDVLGITLQAELTYSNVLEVLDLAGIPLGRPIAARATRSSWPAARRRRTPRRLRRSSTRSSWASRRRRSRTSWTSLDGGGPCGAARRACAEHALPLPPGTRAARRSSRAIYTEFGIETQPIEVVVPYSSAIFSRASVEVMRGCTRGCRFCHAGTWYRPVRERPADQVIEAGLAQLGCTGYDELSLTSLATSDYTDVVPAIEGIKQRMPDLHLSLPSNRVDTGPVALTAAANARQSSITLAPEAATQRMRDIICKTITDEMIERAIDAAFRAGYTSLKMYFMIGLPRETHAEVQGIVDLGVEGARDRAAHPGRRPLHRARQRLELHAEAAHALPVGGHVEPRPARGQAGLHAPGDADPPDPAVAPRRAHLDARGRAGPGRLQEADVIERAWRAGARFDAWTEMFQEQAWQTAFAAGGTTMDDEGHPRVRRVGRDALGSRAARASPRSILMDEWWQSRAEVATGDCRWDGCADCGACFGPVRNKFVH